MRWAVPADVFRKLVYWAGFGFVGEMKKDEVRLEEKVDSEVRALAVACLQLRHDPTSRSLPPNTEPPRLL